MSGNFFASHTEQDEAHGLHSQSGCFTEEKTLLLVLGSERYFVQAVSCTGIALQYFALIAFLSH
jgi:hypothetical protein